jgi:ABC-type glycerol-3-phosphate transport system substrate-binding protein
MKKMHGIALLGAAALLLAACGGGGESPAPVATTDVPAAAQQDAAGLVSYVNGQIGASSDSSEPILVGDAVLPVDDSTETSL